jgi:hypothetical protein
VSAGHVSADTRARVFDAAGNRCGYCQSPQHLVMGWLEVEHIVPVSCGGSDEEENLWVACRLCNGFKGTQTTGYDPHTGNRVRLFNPREQQWSRHFAWSEDGTQILGLTRSGRATVLCLQLNNLIAVTVRRHWVSVGWHPPP